MLKKLMSVRGVGLFRNADGSDRALELRQLSLVYGENAAGKSTLSAVMRSLSTGEATIVTERRTFSFHGDQYINIMDTNGVTYKFEDGTWARSHPNVIVFDSSFVESNIYSGVAIETGHRKSLLEFAIGSASVSEKKAESEAARVAASKRKEVREIEQQLETHTGDMPLSEFMTLPVFDDPDADLVELENQLDQHKRVEVLKNRERPGDLSKPNLDLSEIAEVLGASLDAVHKSAADHVRAHVEQLHNHQAESWISTGLELVQGEDCPFCGQSIDASGLISAYQAYFDDAYRQLKTNVGKLPAMITRLTRSANADTLIKEAESSLMAVALWREDIDLPAIVIDEHRLRESCDELKAGLDELSRDKADEPTLAIHVDRMTGVQRHVDLIMAQIEAANAAFEHARGLIDSFLQGLTSLDRAAIERDIRERKLAKVRHTEDVQELCTRLEKATEDATKADDEKERSRDEARKRMNQLLDAYCEEINRLLQRFNASFQVRDISHDYRTQGDPAIKYALAVRSEVIETSESERLLRAVLSDGDKRTLAFAFFVARLERETSLATKILVLDDPMTSLDKNRQRSTIAVIDDLRRRAGQVIVLAHDPYFLLDLRDRTTEMTSHVVAREFRIDFDGEHSVNFMPTSLDAICRSQYTRDYRTVSEFMAGRGEKIEANRALRPLLEGYLQRRFPLQFDGLMLRQMVEKIETSGAESPLAAALHEVDDLKQLNICVRSVHHGDNPDRGSYVELADAELRADCKAVLDMIHGWRASGDVSDAPVRTA